jgi:hypothetical protein
MNATAEKDKVRTMFWRMFAGAAVGAVVTVLFIGTVGRQLDLDEPSHILAALAGIIYALIGLSVGFGTIAPHAGARFLNVEDADELREESPKLRNGALACLLIGAFLLILALAGDGNFMGREVELFAAAACLVGTAAVTLLSRKRTDELTRQIGLEASSSTLHIGVFVLGGWAALAQFGYVGWMSPLALISSVALLELVAIFAVSARKGLMTPR